MGMTTVAYAAQLAALLPPGQLWRALKVAQPIRGVLLAAGDGMARLDLKVEALLREADPRTTAELLPEWESSTGLPDGCLPSGGSLQQRRDAVVARLRVTGGASEAYFIGLAETFGYSITISYPALSTWLIHSDISVALVNMTCNGDCNDALQSYGNDQLECLMNRAKPAHTALEFAYGP